MLTKKTSSWRCEIVKSKTPFNTQDPENHTLFSSTLYTHPRDFSRVLPTMQALSGSCISYTWPKKFNFSKTNFLEWLFALYSSHKLVNYLYHIDVAESGFSLFCPKKINSIYHQEHLDLEGPRPYHRCLKQQPLNPCSTCTMVGLLRGL